MAWAFRSGIGAVDRELLLTLADGAARGAYLAGSDVTWPGHSPERAGPR